jgi:hypothetical protein
MTIPGGSGGMPGMGYTDTSVAAKLSIDLPSDSVDILKNIAMLTSELQYSMQAAARYGGEFMSYLEKLPQFQRDALDLQKQMLQTLRDTESVQGNLSRTIGGVGGGMGGMNPRMAFAGPTTQYYQGFGNNMAGADRYYDPSMRQPNVQQQQNQMHEQRTQQRDQETQGSKSESRNHRGDKEHQAPKHTAPTTEIHHHHYNSADPDALSDQSKQQGEDRDKEVDRQRTVRNRATNLPGPGQRGFPGRNTGMRHPTQPSTPDQANDPNKTPDPNHSDPQKSQHRRDQETKHDQDTRDQQRGGLGSLLGRITQTSEDVSDTAGAVGPGTSDLGSRAAIIGRLLQGAGGTGGGGGLLGGAISKLGPAAGTLGIAGLGVGAGVAAFNAVQDVGQDIQGFKNQDVRGHTVSGGMGVQKDISLMALNPLISNEQSRQIIMGALNGGYQGDSYDNAVDFIKDNLVNMNVSVSQSVEMLKTNVDLGKQSIESLKLDIGNAQGIATSGGAQTADSNQSFLDSMKQFLGTAGVMNGASNTSNYLTGAFQNSEDGEPNALGDKDIKTSIFTGLYSSPTFLSLLSTVNPAAKGVPVNQVMSVLDKDKSLGSSTFDLLIQQAQRIHKQFPDDVNAESQWENLLASWGLGSLSKDAMKQLYQQSLDGSIKAYANDVANRDTAPLGPNGIAEPYTDAPLYNDWKKSQDMLPDLQTWLAQGNTGTPAAGEVNTGDTKEDYYNEYDIPHAGSGNDAEPAGKIDNNQAISDLIASNAAVVAVDPSGNPHGLSEVDSAEMIGLSNPKSGWKLSGLSDQGKKKQGTSSPQGWQSFAADDKGNFTPTTGPDHEFGVQKLDKSDISGPTATLADVYNNKALGINISPGLGVVGPSSDDNGTGVGAGSGSSPDAGGGDTPGAGVTGAAASGSSTSPSTSSGSSPTTGAAPDGLRGSNTGSAFQSPSPNKTITGSNPLATAAGAVIELSAYAKQFFQITGMAPGSTDVSINGQQSRAGVNGATVNSAPPGTGPTR